VAGHEEGLPVWEGAAAAELGSNSSNVVKSGKGSRK
jgi:hypothetical protein